MKTNFVYEKSANKGDIVKLTNNLNAKLMQN